MCMQIIISSVLSHDPILYVRLVETVHGCQDNLEYYLEYNYLQHTVRIACSCQTIVLISKGPIGTL